MVDDRLPEHWERERDARESAHARLPASLRNDPRPRVREVCETFIETMLAIDRTRTVAIAEDDR